MAFSANKPGDGLHRPLADINVTPLVDVMLVLLIVFMITAPMMTTGLKMDLPQARASQPLKQQQPIVVSVRKDGKFGLDADELPFDALLPALRARMEGDLKRVVQIRGDIHNLASETGLEIPEFRRIVRAVQKGERGGTDKRRVHSELRARRVTQEAVDAVG
jgi:biopolymer transport protein ExbD